MTDDLFFFFFFFCWKILEYGSTKMYIRVYVRTYMCAYAHINEKQNERYNTNGNWRSIRVSIGNDRNNPTCYVYIHNKVLWSSREFESVAAARNSSKADFFLPIVEHNLRTSEQVLSFSFTKWQSVTYCYSNTTTEYRWYRND